MPTPEIQKGLQDLANTTPDLTKVTVEGLQKLRENVAALRKQAGEGGGKEIAQHFKTLYQNIDRHIADQSIATDVREEFQKLREEVIRTMPVGEVFSSAGNVLDRSIQFAVDNPLTVTAGVGTAAYSLRDIFLHPVDAISNPLQTLRTVGSAIWRSALGIAITVGASAAYQALPESFRKNVSDGIARIGERISGGLTSRFRSMLPQWMQDMLPQSAPTSQPPAKLTEEQVRTMEQNQQTQQSLTENSVTAARDRLVNPNPIPLAQEAIKQIQVEVKLIENIPVDRRSPVLVERLKTLGVLRVEMQNLLPADTQKKIQEDEVKTKKLETEEKTNKQTVIKEVTKQLTDTLISRPEGPLLTTPGWEINVRGLAITMGPDAIYVNRDGVRFRMDASMTISGVQHSFAVANLDRRNVMSRPIFGSPTSVPSVRFTELTDQFTKAAPMTAGILRDGVSIATVSGSLAEAAVLFRGGANTFEKTVPFIGAIRITLNPA